MLLCKMWKSSQITIGNQMMEESLMSLILLVIAVSLPQILISIGTEMITHQPLMSMAKAILLWMSLMLIRIKGHTFMDVFDADPHADKRVENLYYPFASKQDWEMASWLLRSGLSMAAVDRFLRLELVSCILYRPPSSVF